MRREDETWNFEHWLRVIRGRWWIIVLCAVVTGLAAVGFSALQRKMYTASAALLFRDPGFDQMIFGSSLLTASQNTPQQQATNIDLVALPTVARRTSAAMRGVVSPGRVASEVSVSPAGQSNVADIAAVDPNPMRAAQLANTYAKQYILFRLEADRAKIAAAQSTIQQQLAQLGPTGRSTAVGQSLVNRANQLRVLASLQTGNAELVQQATVPGSPSTPKTKRNGLLGGLLGLAFGFGLVFLLERLDRRLREPSELEDAYGVPVLGAVPASDAFTTTPSQPLPPAEAEAFALLRARLRYFNVDREVRSILVTSAIPGEGKSTAALNLALADAVSGASNVVLVEGDLRRPSLAGRLGLAPVPGLAEVLSRNVTFEQALQEFSVPSRFDGSRPMTTISVITAGAIPPNPAELIESRAMSELLSTLSKRFEHVIIDSPPTSAVSDAIPLVRQVSGVLVVSRIGSTTRDAARHLRDQLVKLRAPTLGVVANAVRSKARSYYGYAYGYGHAYDPDTVSAPPAPAHESGSPWWKGHPDLDPNAEAHGDPALERPAGDAHNAAVAAEVDSEPETRVNS